MTDSEKITDIQKTIKRIQIAQLVSATIVVLGFLGIFSVAELIKKGTK